MPSLSCSPKLWNKSTWPLSVTSFMPMKLASYPQSFQGLLLVRNIKCLLGSNLSPTGCWPYGNTSLGSCLQGIPWADFSIPVLFFQISLHFYKQTPFLWGRRAMQTFPIVWGQGRVSLSLIRASSSVPALPAALPCFSFLILERL